MCTGSHYLTTKALPYSTKLQPPPSNLWKIVITAVLEEGRKEDEAVAETAELVLKVVERLLAFKWEEDRETVRGALNDVIGEASDTLKVRIPSHRVASKKIHVMLEELEKPWVVQSADKSTELITTVDQAVEDSGDLSKWRSANVGWLMNHKNFCPAALPTMHVPGDKTDGCYDSLEEYFDTVYRLWIGLTWHDGWMALTPSCKWKISIAGDKVCDKGLWPISSAGFRCNTKDCSGSVVMACCNKQHKFGYCKSCGEKRKTAMRGPQGITL